MYRPVGAAGLAELAGTVQRVDDPDPVGALPLDGIPDTLLGEHHVARAVPAQLGHQQFVGELVAGGPELVGVDVISPGAQPEQQFAGALREPPRKCRVRSRGRIPAEGGATGYGRTACKIGGSHLGSVAVIGSSIRT